MPTTVCEEFEWRFGFAMDASVGGDLVGIGMEGVHEYLQLNGQFCALSERFNQAKQGLISGCLTIENH